MDTSVPKKVEEILLGYVRQGRSPREAMEELVHGLRAFVKGEGVTGGWGELLWDMDATPEGFASFLGTVLDAWGRHRRERLVGERGTDPWGTFATPMEVARRTVRQALRVLGREPSVVVDPAVGAGAFIAAYVLEARPSHGLIVGVDLDGVALELASVLVDFLRREGVLPPSVAVRLVMGDALAGLTLAELERLSPRAFLRASRLVEARRFGEFRSVMLMASSLVGAGDLKMLRAAPVMGPSPLLRQLVPGLHAMMERMEELSPVWWDEIVPGLRERGVDLVIGNPPWALFSGRGSPIKRMEERGQLREAELWKRRIAHYRGRFSMIRSSMNDMHRWFLLLPSLLLAPDGALGYVIPDSVLHYPSFSDLRSHLALHYYTGRATLLAPFAGISASLGSLVLRRGSSDALSMDVELREGGSVTVVVRPDGSVRKAGRLMELLERWPRVGDVVEIREGSHAVPSPRRWRDDPHGLRVVDPTGLDRFVSPGIRTIAHGADRKVRLVSGEVGLWRKTGSTIVTAVVELDEPALIHQNVYYFVPRGLSVHALCVLFNSPTYGALYSHLSWARPAGAFAQFRLSHIRSLPVPPFADGLVDQDRTSGALQLVSIAQMVEQSITTWVEEGGMDREALVRMVAGLVDGIADLLENQGKYVPRTVHTVLHHMGRALHACPPECPLRSTLEEWAWRMVEIVVERSAGG